MAIRNLKFVSILQIMDYNIVIAVIKISAVDPKRLFYLTTTIIRRVLNALTFLEVSDVTGRGA